MERAFEKGDKVVVTGVKVNNPHWAGEHFFGTNETIERWVEDQQVLIVEDDWKVVSAGFGESHPAVEVGDLEGCSSFFFLPAELRLATAEEIAEVAHD